MNHREETGLPLDGNAAAGLLRELFALDVTIAEITCGSCGVVAEVGVGPHRERVRCGPASSISSSRPV